jgi:oligoribonuclease
MPSEESNLVWCDLEMTGLEPQSDRILEIAIVITDNQLNILDTLEGIALHQSAAILSGMNEWNTKHHGQSGLTERCQESSETEESAEQKVLSFIRPWVKEKTSPLCGNSICQDRRFLAKYMPALSEYLHYRHIDVSTIKELCRRWKPQLMSGFHKKSSHRALDDILESIEELKYYRTHFFQK